MNKEYYNHHIYVHLPAETAEELSNEARILEFSNRSLLIRYLICRRHLSGGAYSTTDRIALREKKKKPLPESKKAKVVSVKLSEDQYTDLKLEYRLMGYRSVPSYVRVIILSRFKNKDS